VWGAGLQPDKHTGLVWHMEGFCCHLCTPLPKKRVQPLHQGLD
jgi:hypothetical protein